MPRKQRQEKRRTTLTAWQREQLLSGFDFLSDAYGEGEWLDEEAARADWAEYGPGILGEWLSALAGQAHEHGFGHPTRPESLRPWGFWRFTANVLPPDLDDELDVLSDNGLLLPGDEERHARLLTEAGLRLLLSEPRGRTDD